MKDLKDKVAVVTGAASGIGRGMARNFVASGMNVVLADIDEEKLEATVRSLKDAGAQVLGVPVDVSQAEQVSALARDTIDAFGAVHIVCNNAGVGYGGPSSWETPVEGWNWVLAVNLLGVIHGISSFMPILVEQDTEAHLVNTASLAGLVINAFGVPYGVSKHAVVALTESLHVELQTRGSKVKVSLLCPGPVNTDIFHSSERNRPETVPPAPEMTEQEALFRRAYEIWLERGLDPDVVGKQVLEAIREERFYVVTHDFNSWIAQRMEDILATTNPAPLPPPQDLLEILEEVMSQSASEP